MGCVIEVGIGPDPLPGSFRVEVVDSPAGEASAVVHLDAEMLAARRVEMQQAVLASAVSARRLLPETERPVREIGQALFAALLGSGEVAGRYRASAALAARDQQALRVVLRIDSPQLAGLPWEAMWDEAVGEYVCQQDQLVRHVRVASVPAPLAVELPLRVLAVVSSPSGLDPLDVERERELLERALARLVDDGRVRVRWAGSTWAGLHEELLDGPWHVLHFIGHGDFDPDLDEGVLALTREDGRADLVHAHRFASLLRQARPAPRLVVLNSCSGAQTGASDLFSGTAAALVRGGASAVAAMQFAISDATAVAFARGFYTAIARGRGVDEAVSSGRVAILGTSARTLEWVTPVLYLRVRDTRLFTAPPATPAPRARAQQPATPPALHKPSQAPHRPRRTAPVTPSRLIETLTRLDGSVYGVAFSPDGTLLATVGYDQTVRLWGLAKHTGWLRTLSGHKDAVRGVAFRPDGALVATASDDRTVRLWDATDGTALRTLTGHDGPVYGVAFRPNGAMLASASADRTVRLWDTADGTALRTLTGHDGYVLGVAFRRDGRMLATSSSDQTVRLWR